MNSGVGRKQSFFCFYITKALRGLLSRELANHTACVVKCFIC